MAISHAAVPLVGRETELSELTAAYDDVVAGSGWIVMLVGEPGIGKTRLAEELAASAAGKARVLWGDPRSSSRRRRVGRNEAYIKS